MMASSYLILTFAAIGAFTKLTRRRRDVLPNLPASGQASTRAARSSFVPQFGHVNPPHIASLQVCGLLIFGSASPQTGQYCWANVIFIPRDRRRTTDCTARSNLATSNPQSASLISNALRCASLPKLLEALGVLASRLPVQGWE